MPWKPCGPPPSRPPAAGPEPAGRGSAGRNRVVGTVAAVTSIEPGPAVTLLSYVTHEIGNHLAVVQGFGEMLVEGVETLPADTLREFAQAIVRSGAHVRELFQTISDLQRIEQGRLQVDTHEVDLAAVVRERVDLWRPQLGGRRVGVTVPDEVRIVADRDRIGAVVSQLLSNAFRYTPSTATVEIHLAPTDDQVALTVADDGPGVDPGRRGELFERGVATTTGAGVGLFVARHVARAHGGDLVLVDRPAGACFLLRLPR
jgi:signal transduction histidine kinase